MERLALRPSADGVDEIENMLGEARNEPGLASLIHELLKEDGVERLRGRSGESLKFVLIDTLLELGFPHALEVSPEELSYHRDARAPNQRPGSLLAGFTVAAALGALAWNAFFSLMLVVAHERELDWVGLFLTAGLIHSVLALLFAFKSFNVGPERRRVVKPLARLGWASFVGLFAVIVAGLRLGDNAAIGAMVVAAPSILTALLCGVTSQRMRAS